VLDMLPTMATRKRSVTAGETEQIFSPGRYPISDVTNMKRGGQMQRPPFTKSRTLNYRTKSDSSRQRSCHLQEWQIVWG